jgi:DNA-binding NarL/FixJ family response regulator
VSLSERTEVRPDELSISILRRLASGENYDQVAAAEYVSSRTVRRMVSGLKQRTGARTVAALCAEAAHRGWLH